MARLTASRCAALALMLVAMAPVQAEDDLDPLLGNEADGGNATEQAVPTSADTTGDEMAPVQAEDDLDPPLSNDADSSSATEQAVPTSADTTGDENAEPSAAEDSGVEPIVGTAEPLQVITLPEKDVPEATQTRSTSRLVEEIVVTAQKREENLQDVPISVQAFSEEKLEALGATDQDDIQQLVPSLNISKLLSFTTIYLRGIGTDAFLTADPSVATYIDGIYFPFAMGLAQDFGALERIEVLKGPQGTLFGRNATGGALNIVTKDPELDEFHGQANLTVASYPDLHAKAHVNIPLSESAAISISPVYAETTHFIKNTSPNQRKPLEKDVSEGVRLKVRWAPAEWLDATVGVFDIQTTAPSQGLFPVSTATDLGVLLGTPRNGYEKGSDEASLDGCCDNGADNRVYYGAAKFFTPYFDVKLLGSDQFISTRTLIDFDGSGESIATFFAEDFDSDIRTAELQLISNEESWGSEWMKWIAGAYYFDGLAGFIEPGTQLEAVLFPTAFDAVFGTTDPLLNPLRDILTVLDGLTGEPGSPPVGRLFASFVVETKSSAAYLQSTFTLTSWLDLTLGLRYQDESREMLFSRLGALVGDEQVSLMDRDTAQKQDGTVVGPFSSEQTWSPKISLETRPFGEDTLIYLNYQEATKSGTYNGLAVLGPATFADPEKVNAWELGAKASFLFGTLQINGAVFDYDLENLQVQFVSLTTGGSVAFENAKAAKIRGLDLDVLWVIAPHLVDGLVLAGGVGWLETAEYTEYPNARGYTDNSGLAREGQNFSGNRIVKTPKISGNLTLAKSWNVDSGQIEIAGNMYYTDSFFNEPSNRELTVQPAYSLYGAHASYLYEQWDLRVSVFGQNLTDKYHTRGIQPTDFGDQQTIGTPRTYGMRLEWKF